MVYSAVNISECDQQSAHRVKHVIFFLFHFLLAIRKNTIYKLMWWLYKYATIPCITMTW